jgi:hypothetical protein
MSKFEVNKYNIDLMKRIDKYQREILKEGEHPKNVTDANREPKRLTGGSRYVLPSGEVDKMDDQVLTVNVSRDELKAGVQPRVKLNNKQKQMVKAFGGVNRLKKAQRWRDFSVDTLNDGLDLVDKGLTIRAKHDPRAQAQKSISKAFGGKVNRLKKAKRWTGFTVDTLNDGLDLVDKGLTIRAKHDPRAQAQKSISKAFGGNVSKKRLETAINKLESYMSGVGPKPTKLQMELLQKTGVIEEGVKTAKKSVKKASMSAKKAPSAWVQHVQKYARDHNISYKDAMSKARSSYKR